MIDVECRYMLMLMIISLVLVQNLFQIYYFIVVFLLRQVFCFIDQNSILCGKKLIWSLRSLYYTLAILVTEEEAGSLLLQISFVRQTNILHLFCGDHFGLTPLSLVYERHQYTIEHQTLDNLKGFQIFY